MRRLTKFALAFCAVSVVAGLSLGFAFLHPFSRRVTDADLALAAQVGSVKVLELAPLSGWLLYHAGEARPTIVMTHGRSSNRMQMFPLAKALFEKGFNAVLWDLPHHGNSQGPQTYGKNEVGDLLRVVQKISEEPAVDRDHIAVLGFSLGAAMSIGAAAADDSCLIKAAVADSPYASLRETGHWYVRWFGKIPAPIAWPAAIITVRFGSWLSGLDVDRLNPRDWAAGARSPSLIIQGAHDRRVRPDSGREIFERLSSPKEFWLVANAGHTDAFYKNPEAYRDRVAEFVLRSKRLPCVPGTTN